MCGKVEDQGEGSSHEFPSYPDRIFQQQEQQQQQQQQYYNIGVGHGGGGSGGLQPIPEVVPSPPVLPWSLPPFNTTFNPVHLVTADSVVRDHHDHHHFQLASTSAPPSYGLFNPRRASAALQFAGYDPSPSDHLGALAGLYGAADHLGLGGSGRACSASFGLQSELGKMTAQEIMDAKALAASKSHSEAERRRRERINTHLAKLRSLLPNTTKTDKASLLAEVIQHVKDLKRQTSEIAEVGPVPTESDELTVDGADEDGRFLIRASICCEDRSDLLPDLIKTLKALRLRTLKAEITTLGGRVRNVLLVTGEDDDPKNGDHQHSITSIQEALKAVMEKTTASDESSAGSIKRQRTNVSILEHRSI